MVDWFADETGYHPSAPHLPEPVEIPFPEQAAAVAEQIRHAREEQEAEDQQGGGGQGLPSYVSSFGTRWNKEIVLKKLKPYSLFFSPFMLAGGPTTRSDKRNYVKTMICLLQNNVKNAWKYLLQIKDMPFSIKPMQYSVEHSTTFWIIKAKILQMKSGIAGRVWE